jgi:histidine triad (HIT) family protein
VPTVRATASGRGTALTDHRPGCPFCVADTGASGADIVYETDSALALVPRNPAALGHVLVIPRTHIADVWALEEADARTLTDAVLHVAHAIRRALRPDGLYLIPSAGAAASQTVFHLHVHLVPRWHDDQFGDIWPARAPAFPADRTAGAVRAIREALS